MSGLQFANPVRGIIAPYPKPAAAGSFRVTQPFGPTDQKGEPRIVWPGGEGIPKGTYPRFHTGVDISDKGCGANLFALADGKVYRSRIIPTTCTPEKVVVVHFAGPRDKASVYGYGHLSGRAVEEGERVSSGQKVGEVGTTGCSTGCHVHLWAKVGVNLDGNVFSNTNGRPIDPWPLLEQNQPEDDVYPVTRYLPGSTAIVKASARIRSKPALTGEAIRTLTAPETWTVIGFVKGETAEGSTDWLERWAGTAYEYTHSQNVGAITAPAAVDCTPAIAAATKPLQDRLEAVKKALTVAIQL